jgi:hypothetical protein
MLIVDGNNSKNDLLVDLLLLFTMAAPAVTVPPPTATGLFL